MANINNLDYVVILWGAYNAIEKAQELSKDKRLEDIKNLLNDILFDEIN